MWGVWVGAILLATSGSGYVAVVARSRPLAGWETTPREVTVSVEVDQVFSSPPQRKTSGGLGRIVKADVHVASLVGQRVYYSAIKKISIPTQRTGRYSIRGVVEARTPDGTAGFDRYLDTLGIRLTLSRAHVLREEKPPSRFQRFCSRAEEHFESILRHGIDRHPELVSLYLGMLLGEKAVLSAEQQNAFMRSGTFHIFSISGLHVGVIAIVIQSVLQLVRVPRRVATVAGLVALWLYVEITGASAPAVRSFLMVAFLLGSRLFRLPANALAALSLAALCTLLLDPRQLFSPGFQMSYGVVTALILMGSPLAERWQAAWQPWRDLPESSWGPVRRAVRWLGHHVLTAVAGAWVATLASIPSGIGYFGLLSPGALLANLIIIPLSSLAIIAGFIALLGGLGGLWGITTLFNCSAAFIIRLMDWMVAHGTELPGVYFQAQFTQPWMAPAATLVVLGTMTVGANRGWRAREGGFWPPVLAVVLVVFFGTKFG
jgi:competence protein ComEC